MPGIRSRFNVSDWLKLFNYWSSMSRRFHSINSLILSADFPMHYMIINHAVNFIHLTGRGGWSATADMTCTFKVLSIHPNYWWVFGILWNDAYFISDHLTFDCNSRLPLSGFLLSFQKQLKTTATKHATLDGWPSLVYTISERILITLLNPCHSKFTASNVNLQSISPHETFWHLHPHYHDIRVQYSTIQFSWNLILIQFKFNRIWYFNLFINLSVLFLSSFL